MGARRESVIAVLEFGLTIRILYGIVGELSWSSGLLSQRVGKEIKRLEKKQDSR